MNVVIPSLIGGARWCFWTDTQLGYLDGWGKCCRYAGEWSRTRRLLNAARLLDFTCSFHQPLLARTSPSLQHLWLKTLSVPDLAAMCMHAHTHTMPVFSRKRVPVTYTRNFLTQCSTSPIVFRSFSFVLVKQTVIIHLQHCDMWQEQCLFPHCHLSSTSTFFETSLHFSSYLMLFRHN